MPKIDVEMAADWPTSRWPYDVIEGGKRVNSFASFIEAHAYAMQLRDWWRKRK